MYAQYLDYLGGIPQLPASAGSKQMQDNALTCADSSCACKPAPCPQTTAPQSLEHPVYLVLVRLSKPSPPKASQVDPTTMSEMTTHI